MPADPVTQHRGAVIGAADTKQNGDRDRDGDKQNNQSNDDKHVDASDPGAFSLVHAALEGLSTMLAYNVNTSVGDVTILPSWLGFFFLALLFLGPSTRSAAAAAEPRVRPRVGTSGSPRPRKWTEFSVTWGCTPCQPALARVEQARQVVWGIMTVMAMTLQQLRDASDEDLIKAHDDIAHSLNPSVSYYLDELGRRDTERAIRADQKLAKYILYLTVANGLLAVVSICIALAAFLAK